MPNPIPAHRNRGLFYPSAYNLIYYAALATFLPFLAIYYQQQGLSGSQIGLLAGIGPVLSVLFAPFWTGLADASGRHRLVMGISLLGAAISIAMLSQADDLERLAIAISCYSFFISSTVPLSDSATLTMLGGEKRKYGRIRLWGSIGWGIASPLAGKLIDDFGLNAGFWVAIALFLIVLLISLGLSYTRTKPSLPFWHGIRQLLDDRRWYPFLFLAMIGGMSFSVLSNYLYIFMDSLGANKTLMGLTTVVATGSEIPVLFLANRLLLRWGARRLMAASILAYALRAFLVSLVKAPEAILIIQLLHGFTFALLASAAVTLADEMSPPGLNATGQGLFSATMGGVGVSLGALIGGWVYEHTGGAGAFQVSSAIAMGGLILWLTVGKGLKET